MKQIFYSCIMLLLCTTTVINAQIVRKKKINHPLDIYIEEFDLWLPNFKSYPDTIVRKLNDSTYIKMVLRSPKGTLEFYTYNFQNEVLERGQYADALTVFSKYLYCFNTAGEGKPQIIRYYQPVQYGHWEFKTKKGEIPRKETYLKADYP